MIDRLRIATGTAEVLAGLRRSLAGDGVTAALPGAGPERVRTLAMLRPEEPVDEPDAAAVVATSGSTGRPRGVVLSRSALIASAEATHRRLGGPGTWVLALPVHYVAGLMVLVRSLVGGRPPLEVAGGLSGLSEVADLTVDAPRYLSLVPTQLGRAMADTDLTAALRRFTAVLVGGAVADDAVLARAQAAGIRIVTTYGMSETCGGCVYDGRPLDGVDVRAAADGRLSIAGPVLFSGYRLDPVTTADTLVGQRLWTRDRGGVSDGRVRVIGRIDDVVITGGMNVDLVAVEREARRATGEEIAVIGVPDPDWGTRVVAVGTGAGTLQELHDAVRTTLPDYAWPRQRIRVRELPQTAGGKIDRQRLLRELSDRVAP